MTSGCDFNATATTYVCTVGRFIGVRDGNDNSVPKWVVGFDNKPVEDIAVGSEHTIVLLKNGEVWAWGANNSGQVCGTVLD